MNVSSERNDELNSALVSSRRSNKQAEEVLRKYGKTERPVCSAKLSRTFVRGDKVRNTPSTLLTINGVESLNFAERVVLSLEVLPREATGLRNGVKHQLESPDLSGEIRTSGSEGGVRFYSSFLPLLPRTIRLPRRKNHTRPRRLSRFL